MHSTDGFCCAADPQEPNLKTLHSDILALPPLQAASHIACIALRCLLRSSSCRRRGVSRSQGRLGDTQEGKGDHLARPRIYADMYRCVSSGDRLGGDSQIQAVTPPSLFRCALMKKHAESQDEPLRQKRVGAKHGQMQRIPSLTMMHLTEQAAVDPLPFVLMTWILIIRGLAADDAAGKSPIRL